ncbi:cysteine hydrolase [Thalassospira sp. CH_XMU1448-2]|uniref:cysteine hydrolase n=1 Tax=Thalassospira sp. CH_XMU1448-2 TaxID=3107773 RepID=UPI00300A0E3C
MWFALLIIPILIVALIAYTIYGHHRHLTASTGAPIETELRPNTAVLIVDLQEDFTSDTAKNAYPADKLHNALVAINDLVETANANDIPVISIRQKFDGFYINLLVKLLNEGRGSASSTGLSLDDRIDGDIDHDIVKSRADAFHEPELDRVLARHDVGKLIIVGLDGDYCVNATIQGALNRGYDISISDATTLALNPESWLKTKSRLIAAGVHDGIAKHSTPKTDQAKTLDPA